MTATGVSSALISEYVSVERGEVDRRIFSDPDIFEAEMSQIFNRSWTFLAHESQIPKAGDFFEVPMGRDNVLVVRQKDKSVKALLNTCLHRGNAVCRSEEGNVKNFMCTYHGWTYDLSGKLVGVPGFDNLYHKRLEKDKLGLRAIAQADTYKGFIFGTLDPTAPPLLDFLGPTGRLGIDLFTAQGEMVMVPGVQKFVVPCNWKFAVDNLFDFYHPAITHMSAMTVMAERYRQMQFGGGVQFVDGNRVLDAGGATRPDGEQLNIGTQAGLGADESLVLLGQYGHAIGGPTHDALKDIPYRDPEPWREDPEFVEMLTPVGVRVAGYQSIFPNLWVALLNGQLCLRIPRSPVSTELWWFSFVRKDATDDARKAAVVRQQHTFGAAGMLEQEDGENWAQSTQQTLGAASRAIPQALHMNLGHGKIIKEHGFARIEGVTSEHAQLWTYAAWAQYVSGAAWETIKQRTTPGDRI